jgi:predicted transcriptional regulator
MNMEHVAISCVLSGELAKKVAQRSREIGATYSAITREALADYVGLQAANNGDEK